MTYEEALETINIAIAEVEWNYPMDYAIAFEKAKEAIRLQIAEKPSYLKTNKDYICPSCHQSVVGSENYCWNCGKKIDWKE